jgi:hypothetical protein
LDGGSAKSQGLLYTGHKHRRNADRHPYLEPTTSVLEREKTFYASDHAPAEIGQKESEKNKNK